MGLTCDQAALELALNVNDRERSSREKYLMFHFAPTRSIMAAKPIHDELDEMGFAAFRGRDLAMDTDTELSLRWLSHSFGELPVDRDDVAGTRFRRYSRLILLPTAGVLIEQPCIKDGDGRNVVHYQQPISLNSVGGGAARMFEPLHPAVRGSVGLHSLIRFDFENLPRRIFEDWCLYPVLVGVHQISLRPRQNFKAVVSPDHLHCDGEPYTFVHLFRRLEVVGGVNYVAPRRFRECRPSEVEPHEMLTSFTLESFLDGFVVDDAQVCHHVEAVDATGPEAERSVFLIDFTSMRPQFLHE